MNRALTIGIDVGGTFVKAAVVDDAHQVRTRSRIETLADRGFEDVLSRIAGQARALIEQADEPIGAVGIGVPGPLQRSRGRVLRAPNLPGSENVPIVERLGGMLDLPVEIENDANVAAYGEFVAGAGANVHSMVMVTLGTGVGGGVIIEGTLLRGAFDTAGEIGHMIMVPNGRPCNCTQRGCLERYASASAIAERVTEAIKAGEASILAAASRSEAGIDAKDVITAAQQGDVVARRFWDEACQYLALACVNLVHLYGPELIVLAGGLTNAGPALMEPTQASFQAHHWNCAPDRARLAFAMLGGDAGVVGAAALAREALPANA